MLLVPPARGDPLPPRSSARRDNLSTSRAEPPDEHASPAGHLTRARLSAGGTGSGGRGAAAGEQPAGAETSSPAKNAAPARKRPRRRRARAAAKKPAPARQPAPTKSLTAAKKPAPAKRPAEAHNGEEAARFLEAHQLRGSRPCPRSPRYRRATRPWPRNPHRRSRTAHEEGPPQQENPPPPSRRRAGSAQRRSRRSRKPRDGAPPTTKPAADELAVRGASVHVEPTPSHIGQEAAAAWTCRASSCLPCRRFLRSRPWRSRIRRRSRRRGRRMTAGTPPVRPAPRGTPLRPGARTAQARRNAALAGPGGDRGVRSRRRGVHRHHR